MIIINAKAAKPPIIIAGTNVIMNSFDMRFLKHTRY